MDRRIEEKCSKVIEYRFSDPQKAYQICCEILEHGTRNEEYYEVAYARLYMGDTLFSLGKFQEALENMMLAEKFQKKYGYKDLLMKTYNIIAIIYVNQGDGLLGMDYYYKSLKLALECGDEVMQGMVYNNIGALLHNMGDVVGSAGYFRKGYEICRKRERKDGKKFYNKKQYFVNIAVGYLEEKKYDKARKYLDLAAVEKDEESQNYCSAAEINRIMDSARTYIEVGNKQAALEEAEKILCLSEENFGEVEAFTHFIYMVTYLLQLEYYDGARKILTILQKIYADSKVTKRKLRLCEMWIAYYQATGELEQLQRLYRQYYELKQETRKEENSLVIRAIDNRYRLEYERMTNEQLSANARELMKTSEVDELTGISNRYGLKKRFHKLCEIARFQKYPICLGIFDIDGFKSYNDEYGHLKGDECLKEIAQILLDTAGEEYFVSRYGGDEFVILGIHKSEEELRNFIEKLFRNINSARMPFLDHTVCEHVTISMGVINKEVEKDYCLAEFIASADENLYKAKKSGKNRYILQGTCE